MFILILVTTFTYMVFVSSILSFDVLVLWMRLMGDLANLPIIFMHYGTYLVAINFAIYRMNIKFNLQVLLRLAH